MTALRCGVYVIGGLLVVAVIVYGVILAVGHSIEQPDTNTRGSRAVDSLKLIVVVSRHGNRGSGNNYPGDPYPTNNTQYWPYGVDGLTPRGRTQMYNLGKKIRSLYSGFVPVTYNAEDIISRSTYMDRLLMSGEAFLAGLYPPRGFQVWDSGLDWQPTPVYSDSPDNTLVLLATNCPTFSSNMQMYIYQEDKRFADMLTYVGKYVQNATGIDTTSIGLNIGFLLWDKMSAEVYEGYQLPDWAHTVFPDMLRPYSEELYKLSWAGSDETVRLVIGSMYEQALGLMVQKANNSLTPDRKILYYSGHDSSIIGLQHILGVPTDSMVGLVKPASGLVIELHQNNETQQHFIQAVYLDGADLDREPLLLNVTSDFSTLVNNTQKFLNVNLTAECQ